MRAIAVLIPLLFLLVITAGDLSAQTDTPTPEPTAEATTEPYRYDEIEGQTIRYDYTITAGELAIGGLLLVLVASVWLIAAIFYIGAQQRG